MRWPGWMLLAPLAGPAAAHPLDEVAQGAYLFLAPGEMRLELDLTAGIEVAETILVSLDTDSDRTITDPEARAYAERVLAKSTILLDGSAASWALSDVSIPPYRDLELGSGTITIFAVVDRPDSAGMHTLGYENSYRPARSQWVANVFVPNGGSWQYRVTQQQRSGDGRQLTVNYTVTRQP